MYKLQAKFTNDIYLFCLPLEDSDCFAVTLEANEPHVLLSNRMVLYKFKESNFKKLHEIIVTNGSRLTSHFINDYQYVVVAENFNEDHTFVNAIADGSHVYRINHLLSKFEPVQTLSDKRLSDVFLWEQKSVNAIFLAVATDTKEDSKFNTESHIYKWVGTYFDKIDTIKTFSPKCITPFTIGSTMYIAVANFENDQGETDIDSQIFRYNLHDEKFYLYQKLRTHAAMDIKYFCFNRKESFLAVANHFVKEPDGNRDYDTYSVIYKLTEDEYFLPFQSIRVVGALQWLPVLGGAGQFLLLVASRFDGVKAYQYDGWLFVESSVQYSQGPFGPGIATMRQFQFNNENVFAIANKNNDGSRNNIFTVVYKRDDTLPKLYSEIQSWCTETLKEVRDNYSNMTQLANLVKDAPRVNDTVIKMNSSLVFNNTVTIGEVITMTPVEDFDKTLKDNYTSITSFIKDKNLELDQLRKDFEQVPSVLFQKTQHLEKAEFDCHPLPCYFYELHIEMLNGENLTTLLQNSLNLQSDLQLTSDSVPLEFEHIAVQNPVDVNWVNNHKLDDLLTEKSVKNSSHKLIIGGDVIVDNDDGITVLGAIDEVEMSNKSVIMINAAQNFSGKTLIVDSLNIKDLTVRESFNGVPINDRPIFKRDSKDSNQRLIADELSVQDGLISGINITDMFNNVMKLNASKQVVKGYHTYDSLDVNEVNVLGNLYHLSLVPDVNQPSDYSIIDTVIFNGFHNYYEAESERDSSQEHNGKEEEQGEIDSSSARISEGVKHDKNNGSHKFSGVLPINLSKKGKLLKNTASHKGNITYNKDVIIDGRLTIAGGTLKVVDLIVLNEYVDVSELIENALRLDDTNIDKEFVFKTPFKSDSLQVNEINGIKPESWVPAVQDGETVAVTGRKSFTKNINFNGGVIINGTINGIDIKELEKHSDKLQTEEIDNTKSNFTSASSTKDNIKVSGNSDIIIRGTVIVENNVNLHSLRINNDNFINGVNINKFVEDIKNKNVSRNFENLKIFNGNLTIENLFCDDIDGFNLSIIGEAHYCPIVKLNQSGNTSEYLREKYLTADSLQFTGKLDGVSSDDFGKWLLSDGDQEIKGQQSLSSVKTLNGLKIVSNIINDVNINKLFEDGIRIDKTANLSGVIFKELVEIKENIRVDGLVNGIDVFNDVVLKHPELTASEEPIHITGDIIIMNDLYADNIYHKDIDNFCKLFTRSSDEKSLVVNGSVKFSQEPSIKKINNVNIELLFDFAWFTYDNKVINASVFFPDVIFRNNIDLSGNLNNKDIRNLNKNYLSLTADQTLTSSVIFARGITVEGQLHSKKVDVGGYVGGIMIDQFVKNVLLNGTDQIITAVPDFLNITILGDFMTVGLINNLNLESDVMVLNRTFDYNNKSIIVSGYTKIKDVKTNELSVEPKSSTKIQNVNFENWFNSSVKRTGKYVINGHKVFNNGISVSKDIKVEGLVNDVKFDHENILLMYHNQTLTGNNVFNETVDTMFHELYTNYNISGVDVNKLIERLVYTNKDNNITGNKYFLSELRGRNITLPNFYGDLNLTRLNYDLMNYDKYEAYNFQNEFKILRDIEKNVELSILGQAYLLKGWKKIQQLGNKIHVVVPLEFHDRNKNMIGVISSNKNKYVLAIYEWNQSQQFVFKNGSKISLKSMPRIISTIQTHETDSGLKPNTFFIVSSAEEYKKSGKETDTNVMAKMDEVPLIGWLFRWNTSKPEPKPEYHWATTMNHPGILLHVYDSCYVLLDYKEGSLCHLQCQNTFVQSINCINVVQGTVTTDGDTSYLLLFRTNYINITENGIEQSGIMDVWKFNNNKLHLVINVTIENPYSASTIYDSDTMQHLVAVTSGTKLTVFRFNRIWGIIESLTYDVGDKTTVKMRILPTKEVILFLASHCATPSSKIWVGGLSNPKNIPIDVSGSRIKQVIPVRIPDGHTTTNGTVTDYEYYIIVTDTETAVFQPVYSL